MKKQIKAGIGLSRSDLVLKEIAGSTPWRTCMSSLASFLHDQLVAQGSAPRADQSHAAKYISARMFLKRPCSYALPANETAISPNSPTRA